MAAQLLLKYTRCSICPHTCSGLMLLQLHLTVKALRFSTTPSPLLDHVLYYTR